MSNLLTFDEEPADLPQSRVERHEEIVDMFGRFVMWQRNRALEITSNFVESDEAREELGDLRREPYEGIARLSADDRKAVIAFTKETLDCFIERLLWCLGDEGTDARFGRSHAYRFRLELEIVDAASGDVIESEPINRGGKRFFGSYWGGWLNRFKNE